MKGLPSYIFLIVLFSFLIFINRKTLNKLFKDSSTDNKDKKELKFTFLDFLVLISPFIIPFIFIMGKEEIGVTKYSYIEYLGTLLFFIPVIIYVLHWGRGYDIKTGQKFRTKGGIEYDEYKRIQEPDKKISESYKLIIKIHLILGVLVFISKGLFK